MSTALYSVQTAYTQVARLTQATKGGCYSTLSTPPRSAPDVSENPLTLGTTMLRSGKEWQVLLEDGLSKARILRTPFSTTLSL